MATTLDSFLPYLLPFAVGCPTALARRELLLSCIDFSRRTLVLEKFDQLNVVATQQDYTLLVPTDCVITRIKDVMYNGLPLGPTSREMIRYSPALIGVASGTAVVNSGPPSKFFQKAANTPLVSLYPVPDTASTGALVVVYWYEPTLTATSVPDPLFLMYQNEIVDGALAQILLVKGQPFTSAERAADYAKRSGAGIRNAGITARTGQVAVSSRVQMRRFVV